MISGRKPNQKVLEYAQIAGFIFILALVIYANGNDIYKAITGG
jgi:regulator of sigma E protease